MVKQKNMKGLKLLFVLLFSLSILRGQNVLPKPSSYQSVVDKAGLLKSAELSALSNKLDAFEKQTTNEIVVVIIKSLNRISIEKYANELFNEWGIGKKDKDNGLLLLIAIDDRKMRIETGYAVEEYLTDSESANILDELIKPNFKSKLYYEGIELATNYMIKKLDKNFQTSSYAFRNTQDVKTLDLTQTTDQRRKDSLNPWFGFFGGLFFQFVVGLLILKKLKFVRKNSELKDNLEMSIFMVSLFFMIFSFIFSIIAQEEHLYYSIFNKFYLYLSACASAIYFMLLLPKKVGTYTAMFFGELLRIFFCTLGAMLISTITLFFTDSETVFFIAVFLLTAWLYFLSITGKLDWLTSDTGGSSSSYSSSSSSSYRRSSSSSRSSGSRSYGGGSSGGGGASGSW
jgi:uncharacterized protein